MTTKTPSQGSIDVGLMKDEKIKVYDDGKEMISPTEIVPNIVVQRWMNHQRRLNCEFLCDKVKGREQDVRQQSVAKYQTCNVTLQNVMSWLPTTSMSCLPTTILLCLVCLLLHCYDVSCLLLHCYYSFAYYYIIMTSLPLTTL